MIDVGRAAVLADGRATCFASDQIGGVIAEERRLETVIANWFPRFIANDLDALDVQRTLDRIDRWEAWAPTWVDEGARYERLGEDALERGHRITAASHLRRAALTYQFAQFVLHEDPEGRERIHRRQADVYRRAAPLLDPPARAIHVELGDDRFPGYLRMPAKGRAGPIVIFLPGLESTKEQFSAFEPFFLARGIATMSFEGPGQGEAMYTCPFRDDHYEKSFGAALGVARSIEDVDPERVAVVGTSFGGYLALRCGAMHPDLAGLVDIAGPYDLSGFDDWQPVTQESFMHFVGASDLDEARALGSDVTLEGRLEGDLPPVLIVHGDQDPIIPPDNASRISSAIPKAELWLVEGGNHSCNNLHTVIQPAIADWVADQVGATA